MILTMLGIILFLVVVVSAWRTPPDGKDWPLG